MNPSPKPPKRTLVQRFWDLPTFIRLPLFLLGLALVFALMISIPFIRGAFPDVVRNLLEPDDSINVEIDTDSVTMPVMPTLRPRATLAPIIVPTLEPATPTG
jgi:hypothetical protein